MAGDDHAIGGGCYEQMSSSSGGNRGPVTSSFPSSGGMPSPLPSRSPIPLRFDSIVSCSSSSSGASSSTATPRTSGVGEIFRKSGDDGDGPPYVYAPPKADALSTLQSIYFSEGRASNGGATAAAAANSQQGQKDAGGQNSEVPHCCAQGGPSGCDDPAGPSCCQYPRQASTTAVDHSEPNNRLSRASTVGASVTFLKALLGVSLLSHPRILSETGLMLGTITHIVIILACAFACYLLLKAREMAAEAMARREEEEAMGRMALHDAHASGSDLFLSDADFCHIKASGSTSASNPRPFEVACGTKDRLMTYGDVSRQLMGQGAALVITWTIVVLHVLFASGMASGVISGTSMVLSMDIDNGAEEQQRSGGQKHERLLMVQEQEEEQSFDDMYWAGRWGLALMLFPVVAVLLQMPTLRDLFVISAAGLTIYLGGCVGCLIYTALETAKGEGRWTDDAPEDLWEWKFGGIPVFVASTLYTIEGINLALPTANNMDNPTFSVPVVCMAVCVYGLLTLGIAWIGYIGGLGGGPGTEHEDGLCRHIFLCMESPLVRAIYQVSMCVALLLTLPVILYPSTEILEIWATELDEERRRKKIRKREELELSRRMPPPQKTDCINKDCLPNDCVDLTVGGVVPQSIDEGINHISEGVRQSLVGEAATFDEMDFQDIRAVSDCQQPVAQNPNISYESSQVVRRIKVHRRLRFTLAVVVCFLGAAEEYVHTAFSFIRGIGLSFAGFILPPILYIIAREETERHVVKLKGRMLIPLACLIGFGFFNIVLVFVSSFTNHHFRKQ